MMAPFNGGQATSPTRTVPVGKVVARRVRPMSLTKRDLLLVLALVLALSVVGAATQLAAPAWSPIVVVIGALAAALLVILDTYRRVQGTLAECQNEPGQNYRQIEALFSLHAAMPIESPLPPMRGPVISPDFGAALISLIREIRPRLVVEAGSGVSTLILAYGLKGIGQGRLVSLEEDAEYADTTRRRLREHGLESLASVMHAPLKRVAVGGREATWYDLDTLGAVRDIDLMVIDGPRQDRRPTKHVRYPALPLLFARMSEHAAVILDDCNRRDEQEIVERWLREYTVFRAEPSFGDKRHIILRRQPPDR